MSKLTREQVRHVAMLARLRIEDGEEEFYADELSGIMSRIERLQQLDTADIPPTAQVVEVKARLRADEPAPSLTQKEALANVPAADRGFILVKGIQEDVT